MGTDMQFQIILFYGNYSENVKTMGVVNDMIGNFRVQKCFVLGVLFESSWELVLLDTPRQLLFRNKVSVEMTGFW